jgi:GTP cyclohydrolase I
MYDYDNDEALPIESRQNMDLPKIENAVREILEAIGEDTTREGIRETPQRVARMYAEIFSGLHRDI